MQEKKSRERVLKNIRKALIQKAPEATLVTPQVDLDSEVFARPDEESLLVMFAEQFNRNQGRFVYCQDRNELHKELSQLVSDRGWEQILCLEESLRNYLEPLELPFWNPSGEYGQIDAGITSCTFLISRIGAIMVTSQQQQSRVSSVYPPVHLVIAHTNQVVYDIRDALGKLSQDGDGSWPSMTSIIAGPSRTADIEKTLVLGAHGPKELYLFLIDE